MAVENVNSISAAATYTAMSTPAAAPVKEAVSVDADAVEKSSMAVSEPVEIKKVDDTGKENNASTGEQEKQPSDASIRQALKDMNKKLSNNTIAEFGIHEGTNRVMIKIKDKETDEVIREVPAEKTLDLIQKAWEMAGILVDEKR
ncbi:MAG: flagellar protein FlaG [Lachnospiraceae bacterium]|nr:flagellar protein FlaG [Lachnospiraceae bacterium]